MPPMTVMSSEESVVTSSPLVVTVKWSLALRCSKLSDKPSVAAAFVDVAVAVIQSAAAKSSGEAWYIGM